MTKNKIIFSICTATVCAAVTAGVLLFRPKQPEYDSSIPYIHECELKYWGTKSQLVDEVDAYIKENAPTSSLSACILVDACEEANVDVKFVLAQGKVESHFGTKGLASKTNSVWNVGAYDSLSYSEILSKHKFKHPNESIKPYLTLLKEQYMTSGIEEALLLKFVNRNGKRWASDINYEERLRYEYNFIKENTKIDSLSLVMQHWAIQTNR